METYYGHVRTPADAIILFEACRLGLLPRVQRRLSEKERQSIRSGSVFVWDEREAGMRRWTDGKSWSASRVSGSFLTYREMEGKRGGNGFAPVTAAQRVSKTPEGPRGSDSDLDMGEDGPDGYRYKPDGLMKQSFSITTSNGQHLHLISYYARSHPAAQGLQQPSSDQSLRNIRPQKGMYPESTVHEQSNVPVVTRGPMLGAPFAGSPLGMSLAPPGYHHARSGPPPPQMYLPHGYAWAPTPVMGHHQYAIHPHMAGQMGPPPMAGLSPLQYAVPLPPTSQGPPPGAYDRRPLSAGSLPPPNTGGYRGETSMPPSQSPVPSRDGPQPPGSGGMIDPRLQPTSGQSNQSPSGQHQSAPQQASPRENGTTGTPPIGVLPNTPEKIEGTPVKDPPTSASTIPSIGALVNGAMKDGIDVKREMDGGRAGSRSPGETQKRENAPPMSNSEKLPFGEDTRVLRVLDKVFPA